VLITRYHASITVFIYNISYFCYCCSAKATHQIAEANQARNNQLKAAFGLSEFYKEGSSMDPQRKTKEEAAKALALAQKKYAYVLVLINYTF